MLEHKLESAFDHLIFASYDLKDGVHYVKESLGVDFVRGGQHFMMGTHNSVLKLTESTYVEVIGIDPTIPKPARPRWFGMDKLRPDTKPSLLTWVVRTNDIEAAVKASQLKHGKIETLTRGIYEWRIAIPEDGQMPLGGIAPTIIQWKTEVHPAQRLHPSEITLESIEAYHPSAAVISSWLSAIGYMGKFKGIIIGQGECPKLKIELKCPKGVVAFESTISSDTGNCSH